ncbi:MAG: hypothetical protein A3K19_01420 [Lentisphaerae bacterium RIFOXYB12_FULL_65_16]|nr:MAG: hypothetical protein A3K18_22775 [Lentisphaerae bacterium RIFOXYA12_64_32]OGV92801.1 MAG: hypothetical protein A3K19_01420 [Lentisphaerae bacterium RIFOXYB12_FULL_65_16]
MKRRAPRIPLPRHWPAHVDAAVQYAAAMAHAAIVYSRSWCVDSPFDRVRLAGRLEQARDDNAADKEELRIKTARMERVPKHCRPHYTRAKRRATLELKAAQGWSIAETARRFQVTPETVSAWLREARSTDGTSQPVNRYPDFVRHLVQRLKIICPGMGYSRIANVLGRASLHLAKTTVERMLAERAPAPVEPPTAPESEPRRPTHQHGVKAKYPDQVWHVDLTLVPTSGGFAIPWLPFALLQCWPFCYWVLAVVDQFSRALVGFAIYHRQPTSEQVCSDLNRLAAARKLSPKYTVSDKGPQFRDIYKAWCESRKPKIKPRFGAVGKKGSIAVVERFILSLKEECIRCISVPFAVPALRTELNLYMFWYNHHRPHQALDGRTPFEVYHGIKPANETLRFEPRPDWPLASPCAGPQAPPRRPPGLKLELDVSFLEGRQHLPIVEVRQAA